MNSEWPGRRTPSSAPSAQFARRTCPCGTAQYCTVACQRIDWRDRGHRKACKKIRDERAAETARAEAPTPAPEVVYGPAPWSHADEIRARIAAEHEAARVRREANPEPEPESARYGSRCPICLEKWDVNESNVVQTCCCRTVCGSCAKKIEMKEACPLCRALPVGSEAEQLAQLRRHVENEVPEAIAVLAIRYRNGDLGLAKSAKKAAKLYKRAVELGSVSAMIQLGNMYEGMGPSGVKTDEKKAVQLFRMAANRGHAMGQQNLATHLREIGCEEEAFRYYKLAAEQGLATATTDLGNCYEFGVGVAQDLDEALRLHTRAAAITKKYLRPSSYHTDDIYELDDIDLARTIQSNLDRITQTLAARRR